MEFIFSIFISYFFLIDMQTNSMIEWYDYFGHGH